ncbi:hypothetical protein Hena1_01890 [Erwinia phage Hena1]|uniref:Uncharacterized protein n=1 Tax=Erwinia phage Hena1 TaxID=2678601 RepID=A0A6B9J9Y3_9CAUD|nr:hypothetical protein HWC84_gp175 [Erwinia phage Hena1]QGZ16339.1 hypothetical protein Hena1_01890 [Erwinia phage Hena1]
MLNEAIKQSIITTSEEVKSNYGIDLMDDTVRQNALFFWGDVYLNERVCKNADPHQMYADLLGISRQGAKTVCYLVHYLSDSLASKIFTENNQNKD